MEVVIICEITHESKFFPGSGLRAHNQKCSYLTPGKDRSANRKLLVHETIDRRCDLEIFGTQNHFWMWVKWWDMKHSYVIWGIGRGKTKNRVLEILTKILVDTLCCSFFFFFFFFLWLTWWFGHFLLWLFPIDGHILVPFYLTFNVCPIIKIIVPLVYSSMLSLCHGYLVLLHFTSSRSWNLSNNQISLFIVISFHQW